VDGTASPQNVAVDKTSRMAEAQPEPPLAKRVRARLAELRLGPTDAANAAGLQRNYVTDIVRGKKQTLQLRHAAKLAEILQCSVEWLNDGLGPPPAPPVAVARRSTLGSRLREQRTRLGFNQDHVARLVGVTKATVSLWELDRAEPSATALAAIARGLATTPTRLLEGDAAPPPADLPADFLTGEVQFADVAVPAPNSMPRDVPVLGTAAGSIVGAFQFDGVVDYVRRPPALAGVPNAYALYVKGESMVPEHPPGELRFVHPGRPVRPGDAVVVQTRLHEQEQFQAYIKRFVREDDTHVVLWQHNKPAEIKLDRRIVVAVHRVLTMNELFGV